jgi:hypothetical protein
MTISREQRRAYVEQALKLLLKNLGGNAIDYVTIDPIEGQFAELPPTTWKELKELQFVRRDSVREPTVYRLTGEGWIEALAASGQYDSEDLVRRLGGLSAYLKGTVKGRQTAAAIPLRGVAAATGNDEDWIFNVVESNLLEVKFGRRGAHWHPDHRGRMIVVPITFGVEPVDAHANLRAKIEALEQELAEREERLSEFQCPHCGAALSQQGPVPTEYGDDFHQSFECGFAQTDGRTTSPCPSSDEFPKFDEYELVFHQSRGQVDCWAKPRTDRARLLSLHSWGRTEEEAAERVRERYEFYANWKVKRR